MVALPRTALFSHQHVLTPSPSLPRSLCQSLITTWKGCSSLFTTFYRTRRAGLAENTVAGIVPSRSNMILNLELRPETTNAASPPPIPAYSPDILPTGYHILVAKSNLQSRSRKDCSKLTFSLAGPLHSRRPFGIPRIHPPVGHCSS